MHPSHPQPRSRRLPRATAHGGTRVPIGRNAGGHGEAGMESEGRDGILSPFLGASRVDDYNTEATDVYSTAATESLLWPFPSPLRSGVSTFPRHSDQTATRPAPQISEERCQTIETARQSWIRKLIDLSRRNNLLYFRPLKTGTLELTSASSRKASGSTDWRECLGCQVAPHSKFLCHCALGIREVNQLNGRVCFNRSSNIEIRAWLASSGRR